MSSQKTFPEYEWSLLATKMARYSKLTRNNIAEFLCSFDTVLTDCDGVLWNGPEAIVGAPESFQLLHNMGKRIFPVTNNSTKTREQYKDKCTTLGFPCEKEDIVGSSYVTSQYIKHGMKYCGKVFMLGSMALYHELRNAGLHVLGMEEGNHHNAGMTDIANMSLSEAANLKLDPEVKCVVVGFDEDFNYLKMAKACSYLRSNGCAFVATNTDEWLPMGPGKFLPGTGAIVAAVATAAGREPDIICGKPFKTMFDVVQERHHVDKSRTIMIGDRLNTDILLAHNCGIRSLHVLTGVHHLDDVQKCMSSNSIEDQKMIPDYYVESFADIAKLYNQANSGQP